MPIALWCVLISAILPILAAYPAKTRGGFDNSRPRDPDFWRAGFAARAQGAMANGFEAFPFFAAAVLVALTQGGSEDWAGLLAVGFVVARIGYTVAYWQDRPTLRSAVWTVGFGLTAAIFLTPIWAPVAGP